MILTAHVYEEMKRHALQETPRECVGLLGTDGDRLVSICPLQNTAPDPTIAFAADDAAVAAACRLIDWQGYGLATYHSHPQGAPALSKRDVKQLWPGFLHVVIGMGAGCQMRGYIVQRDGRIDEVPLELESAGLAA